MNTLTKNETKKENRPATQNQGAANVQYVSPEVNIYETKEGYILEAEMPGVNRSGLDVTLEGNELTIMGRRDHSTPQAEVVWRESVQADYRRVFELDPAIDTNKIEARMEQGVLILHLPKSERVKPRKVTVSD